MSVTLIGKDDVPVNEVANCLTRSDVECVFPLRLSQVLNEPKAIESTDLTVFVSVDQASVDAGEGVEQIRQVLGPAGRLVVCMPRPSAPQDLLSSGADEIISPASISYERIAERILGQLIVEKRIKRHTYGSMRGATKQMHDLYEQIERFAPLKQHVLIRGETGTGKTLVAEALHAGGSDGGKFVPVNCSAVHNESLDSELFGHVQGAFTGAIRNRTGLIEEAKDGTAFFDEIGDLSPELQIKLLDVVDTKKIRRLGGNAFYPVNSRFVFATHQDLEERIEQKLFRQDLYARISRLVVVLAPLRERLADIPLLVEHFLAIYNQKNSTSVEVKFGAVDELFRYDWPLNVRELDSVVERAAATAGPDGGITDTMMREAMRDPRKSRLGFATNPPKYSVGFDPFMDRWRVFEARAKFAYFKALTETTKTEKEAEVRSGVSRSQLHNIRTELGLKRADLDPRGD